jgi:aspartate racemase
MTGSEIYPQDTSIVHDKVVGVIGGMGPEATADFFRRVIRNTPADTDQDHLHILIDNNPKVPNRHDAIEGVGPTPADSFAESAQRLQSCGAEFLVMPCNTAHAFEHAITSAVDIPFISIVDETCKYIQSNFSDMRTIGLLAADGCLRAGLYDRALEELNVTVQRLSARRQNDFMQLVFQIKSSGVNRKIRTDMKAMAQDLIESGAQGILAGCTEVPLVLSQSDLEVPLIDSTEILATQCVQYAKGSNPLPVAIG